MTAPAGGCGHQRAASLFALTTTDSFRPGSPSSSRSPTQPACALISSADPTGGKEGGVPDSYRERGPGGGTDEPGSSYLYQFSAAPRPDRTYLGDKPGVAEVDANKDGAVSWSESRTGQPARHEPRS